MMFCVSVLKPFALDKNDIEMRAQALDETICPVQAKIRLAVRACS